MARKSATPKALIPLLAALLLLGCSEEGERVGETDLKVLFSETVRVQFATARFKGTADLRTNKSAYLSITGLGEDTGNWWLEGETVCAKWKKALRGKPTCVFLKTFSDGSFAAHNQSSGARIGTFQIRKQ